MATAGRWMRMTAGTGMREWAMSCFTSERGPVDTATVFRLYTYAPAAANGIFFDSISVSGTLVPEPSAAILFFFAAAAALRRRR